MKEVTYLIFLFYLLKAMKKRSPFLPAYFLMQISELRISLYPAPAEWLELDLKG